MAEVRLENITKKFDEVVAVDDVNLHINDKEFVTLLGPSGCGKTTTLRLIAGLEEQTSGNIFIGDMLANDLTPRERDIAMVFQSYALYPHMSVRENIAFGLKIKKIPKAEIEARVKETADVLNIEDLLDRKPRQLSGGQRQRVALGRAIARHPTIYLMDEPLSNLDAKLRVMMRAELIRLQKELATTLIYVTHDQVEAMTMADRIAIFNEGELLQYDTPKKIYDDPNRRFVGEFVGSPGMNFIEGSVKDVNGKSVMDAGAFEYTLPAGLVFDATDILLGTRPEDMVVSRDPLDNSFEAEVYVVEPLGENILVTLAVDSIHLITKLDPDTIIATGDKMNVTFDEAKMHIYDAKTESLLV